jgi:hypothetical protein
LAKAQRSTEQTSLTEAEEQLGMCVKWMMIGQAIKVMDKAVNNSKTDNYGNFFMLMRDRMILKEAARLLERMDLF